MTNTEVVRTMFDAYLSQDADTAMQLLAEDFTFTSPQDDHINKTAFMERCFPTVERLASQQIITLVPASEDAVFIMYEYALKSGERHRNVEYITVRDDQLAETQVFFGGSV